MKRLRGLQGFLWLTYALVILNLPAFGQNGILVFQSDFGLKDGAVSAMKGVAIGIDPNLRIHDVTHEIPAYNIWEASYRLMQTAPYWPKGTVFVSVVDPGVGTVRKSVVLLTNSGHYFVTPDNGTLTLVAEQLGIKEIREIDEVANRRKDSGQSYTFHGRDVYAFTAARLASKTISFEKVGPRLTGKVVAIPYQKAVFGEGKVVGTIPILDVQYGNVWTNIDKETFKKLMVKTGARIRVKIFNSNEKVYEGEVTLVNTFGDVPEGENVGYFNSLLQFSVAINMGNFAEKYHVQSGSNWKIELSK
ncbi:S-adenosyl-l-methionine hydroxide adenosyltransferase family protein [Dyadobacter sp. 32]|uniref:SAM hydrolase/SAM-dependent halogenase family protein n=1 Tax=Dyadobacter sp. 32 TaxID=538966 RepID=UPI0011EECC25